MKRRISAGRYSGGTIHPGTILREDYLAPLELTALRLARYLGITPALWLNLQ